MEPAGTFLFRGTDLAFYRFPAGATVAARAPIVFFHATGFSAPTYRPLFERLTAAGHAVIALDFFGHGRSGRTGDFSDWYFFRDQALAFLDHTGLDRAYAVGHSLGGATALLAGARAPDRLLAVAGLDPVVLTPLRSFFLPWFMARHPLARAAEKRRASFASRKLIERSYRAKSTFRDWHPDSFAGYLDSGFRPGPAGTLELALPPELEARVFRAQNRGHWAEYRKLRQPVCIIAARGSVVTPIRSARLLTRAHPASRAITHATGSHFFPMTDPEGTARHLLDFFAAVAGQ